MSDSQVHQLYIHGRYVAATSGKTFTSINPANGEVIATLSTSITTRHRSGCSKRSTRSKIWAAMTRWSVLVFYVALSTSYERNDELARLETLDTGKAYSETSTVDIVIKADVLEYYAFRDCNSGRASSAS